MVPMTPEVRIQGLQQMAADFSAYLKTVPGTILSPNLRLGVTICARDALKCSSCHRALKDVVCLRPGSSFHAYCSEMGHGPEFPVAPESDRNKKIEACLVNIVHAVVCHQNRLDEIWYNDAIVDLRESGILDVYAKEFNCTDDVDEMNLASSAVFIEIVILAAASHGIYSTFLGLGKLGGLDGNIPPLPSWDEMRGAPGPSNIRFSLLLNRVRQYDSIANAPYFHSWDADKLCPEYAKVEKDIWKQLASPQMPNICGNFSPRDNVGHEDVMKENATSEDCNGDRERALLDFGSAMANLAVDVQKAPSALEEVKKIGGMELAVEAVCVAGAFEMMTKVVDASGRKAQSKQLLKVMQGLMFMLKHRVTIGIIGASVMAPYVVNKLARWA
ncbi:hypothetical protein ACHAWX_000504 [Stephanocyclus meneghinianus]